MADETPIEEDPQLTRLKRLNTEFIEHRARLQARSKEIQGQIEAGELAPEKLPELVLELFLELQDTSLSLQQDLAFIVHDDWVAAEDEEDEEDAGDDEDDAPEEGDEDDDAAFDSQLLPDDAKQLRRTALDYVGFLDAMIKDPNFARYDVNARQQIVDKFADAQASVELIDGLEMTEGDPPVAAIPAN